MSKQNDLKQRLLQAQAEVDSLEESDYCNDSKLEAAQQRLWEAQEALYYEEGKL